MKFIFHITLLLLICGCSKEHSPIAYESTKLIAHRGNGSIASGQGQSEENTLDACSKGFSLTDGVEIDVQRSNDYEVYLFHDVDLEPCDENDIKTIPASTKSKINEYFDCVGQRPNTLTQLLQQNTISEEDKDIFIDVKSIAKLSTSLKMPSPQHYLNLMAQDMFKLIEDFPFPSSINIESENGVLLNAFQKHQPKTQTWLACYGDMDRAVRRASKESYTGISIKDGSWITDKSVSSAHEKGLKICVWVVNDQARYDKLKGMEVDVVQTDNLYLEK